MPKLTKRFIDNLTTNKPQQIFWDTEVTGFGIRLTSGGNVKTYIIQYRTLANESRRLKIGPHGVFTVDAAREQARLLLHDARIGKDPAALRHALRASITVAKLAEEYESRHAARRKKPSSCRADNCNIRNHVLPKLGSRKVCQVTQADVMRMHEDMCATRGAADRVLALLSKMFNLAETWGYRERGSNPCRGVPKYGQSNVGLGKARYLSADEMARLGAELARHKERANEPTDLAVVAAVQLLIFTGARLNEILSLRWRDVDMPSRALKLPDSKTGAKIIHLNAPALEVLGSINRGGSDWVIQGRKSGEHLVNLRKAWHGIRARANLPDVRLHDLRHSFASFGAAGGLSLPIIGALLGHTNTATTARYAHLSNDPLKRANDMIGQHIAAAMQGQMATIARLRTSADAAAIASELQDATKSA